MKYIRWEILVIVLFITGCAYNTSVTTKPKIHEQAKQNKKPQKQKPKALYTIIDQYKTLQGGYKVVMRAAKSEFAILFLPGKFSLPMEEILQWMAQSINAVAGYYGGRFPVSEVYIRTDPGTYGRIGHGRASGYSGAKVQIKIGPATRKLHLNKDWVFVHELTHLGFPTLAERHRWMEEGMATYLEPIMRVRAGIMPEKQMWKEMIEGMPNGLSRWGEYGLDNTYTWGSVYWGGALYWFLVDLEIRRRTNNRKGLEQAMQNIAKHGDITSTWKIERVIRKGDEGIGIPVLLEFYELLKDKPVDVNLGILWKQLGVGIQDGEVVFDNSAPLASLRKAIAKGGAR